MLKKPMTILLMLPCLILMTTWGHARMLYQSQTVDLYSMTGESDGKNQHPVDVSVEQLEAWLSRIDVISKNTDNQPVALFPGANALAVAKELHTSLRHINADTDLLLIGYRRVGGLLSSTRYATSARVFVRDGRLNWIMGPIDIFNSEFRDNDKKLPRVGTRQTSVDVQGQLLVDSDQGVKKPRQDWLSLDLRLMIPAADGQGRGQSRLGYQRPQMSTPGAAVKSIDSDSVPKIKAKAMPAQPNSLQQLEREFELLQRLKQKGIITEEDFQQKKSELLKRL